MNRDHPKIISDQTLYKKVFKYNSSLADNRFFRQKIVDFIKDSEGKTFSDYMFQAIWERNEGGKTSKYCYFDEHNQKVKIDMYFFEWMTRTIRKADSELLMISGQNDERIATQQTMPQGTGRR